MFSAKQFRYYAFISYSRKNSKAAAYLHKQMEHFRIPVKYVAEENRPKGQKFLRPIFRDRRDLEAGEGNFTSHIKTALGESRYLIVLCSQEAAASIWVNEEIKHFLATHNNDYNTIVPVILNGEPGSKEESECLPEALQLEEITIRNLPSMIPDEGDEEKTGWENGVIQAMSYMLKINREKIKESVDAEKVHQAKIYAAIGVVTTVIFALLTTWAIHAEWQAKEQAESSQKTMEFLTKILEASDPGKGGKNKITVIEAIKSKIPDLDNVTPWHLRVDISKKIASLLDNMGEYEEALKIIDKACQICKQKQPNHYNTAIMMNTCAVIQLSNKDYSGALENFLAAKKIFDLSPEKYMIERARIYNNIGTTYMYVKKYDKALKYCNEALTIRLLLQEYPIDLSNTYTVLGLIYYTINDNKKALEHHQKALAIKLKNFSVPNLDIANSLYFISLCFYRLNKKENALKYIERAHNIALQQYGTTHPMTQQYKSVRDRFLRSKPIIYK